MYMHTHTHTHTHTHFDHPEGSVRVVHVQVVNVARDRDGKNVSALPQAAHLLILYLGAHLELTAGNWRNDGRGGEGRGGEGRGGGRG